MRRLRRGTTALLTALLLLTLLAPWGMAAPAPGTHQTTVLFTHDLHSHFLPLEGADGGESGGYARLASALEEQRALHPDALTLDGGGLFHRLPGPDPLHHPGGGAADHGCSGL